jgi:hypothetical protein
VIGVRRPVQISTGASAMQQHGKTERGGHRMMDATSPAPLGTPNRARVEE